ncbi:hypothetical protein FB451DRAFT_1558412 [Mycena latifolia]|nr:hypothetical protein FB451DRAFT_1558412 [Mycena latifolia]
MGSGKKPDKPADKKRPGRPPRKFRPIGKAIAKAAFQAIVGAFKKSPEPDIVPAETHGTPLTGEAARATRLASQTYGARPERKDPKEAPVFLDSLKKLKAADLKLIATIPTEDCAQWFDDQLNDYTTKGPVIAQAADVKWFGHPGDSGSDIRARKFVVRWSKYLADPELDVRKQAVKEGKVLCRWKYFCSGLHDRDIEGEDDGGSEGGDGSIQGGEGSNSTQHGGDNKSTGGDEPERGPDRWSKCSGQVRLYCEVTADDLTHIKIWQMGTHEDAPRSFPFTFPRHLRLIIMEWLRRYGAKATAVNRDLVNRFENPDSAGNAHPLPTHRRPTLKQIRQMIPAERHRARLDRNPFRATHLMVERNPRDIYTPHDFSKPDKESKFSVAITDDFSLDSTILNTAGRDGALFLDSTHRLHNQNRAPTTVVCTANSDKHMMPGAYLISANIKADTLKGFILETIAKIEARAREIVADKSKIQHRSPKDRDRIFARCQEIVEKGFKFSHVMIDKSGAELKALLAVLEELGMHDVYIRLCQFHVIQAILRWDSEKGLQGIGFSLSDDLKFEICELFRVLQRCRTWEAWPETKQIFYDGLNALLTDAEEDDAHDDMDSNSDADHEKPASSDADDAKDKKPAPSSDTTSGADAADAKQNKPASRRKKRTVPTAKTKKAKASGLTCLQAVTAYFDENWFIDRWIPYYTDIGMPPDQSRDGTWNTNNWAETAFKQFNSVFLDNKHNKRIDRLALVILMQHLPYFKHFPTPSRPESRDIINLNLDAYEIWENDLVHPAPTPENSETFKVNRMSNGTPVQYMVVLSPLSCECRKYNQTGKACVDILAARLLKASGPVSAWIEMEEATELQKAEDIDDQGRMRDDDAADKQLYKILDKLEKSAKKRQGLGTVDSMDFGDFKVVNRPGRPLKMPALHPWRRRNRPAPRPVAGSYSPRFTKKRGPRKTPRLAWNSLFPASGQLLSACLRIALMRRRAALMRCYFKGRWGRKQSNSSNADNGAHLTHVPHPHDDDPFLNAEDLSLGTWGLQHWVPSVYELRMDEIDLFISFFNNSILADQGGFLFLYGAPQMPFTKELRDLDWSQPLSLETLRAMKLGGLADLLDKRTNHDINHIIFFQLIDHHWTIFHHVLNSPGDRLPHVHWYNSLPFSPGALQDIQDQQVMQQYFVRPRSTLPPPPELYQQYTPVYLGLQHDSHACGWWAVYVASALILGFNPDNRMAHEMDALAVKELTGTIYTSFVGDGVSVPMELMRNLFAKFEPTTLVIPPGPDAIMSRRPQNIDRQVPTDISVPPVALVGSLHPSQSTETTAPVLDANYSDLTPEAANPPYIWAVGNTQMTPAHMERLVRGQIISDGVIDGYFFCYLVDHLVRTRMYVADVPFCIAEREISEPIIQGPRAKNKAMGMPPPPRTNAKHSKRERWFEKFNVFEKERLIIPVFWKPLEHWLLAAVFFKHTQIRIYDSIKQPGGSRARAIYNRIMEVLLFEHLYHYNSPLPDSWRPWSQSAMVPAVPQQNNAFDCGIFTIAFARVIAEGGVPDAPAFVYTPADAAEDRIKIANRLSRGIRADPVNEKALRAVEVSPSFADSPSPVLSSTSVRPISPGIDPSSLPTMASAAACPESSGRSGEAEQPTEETQIHSSPVLEDTFINWQRPRQTQPRVNGLALFHPPNSAAGLFLPARVTAIGSEELTLEWFCEFKCTLAEWMNAVNRKVDRNQVIPLRWPAALARWQREARSFLPASDIAPALAAYLESHVPEVVSALRGNAVPDMAFMKIMDDARTHPHTFLENIGTLLWRPAPAHTASIREWCAKIERQISEEDQAPQNSAQELQEQTDALITVRRLCGVMLWVSALGFLTNKPSDSAYIEICQGHLYRRRMDVERIWGIYAETCEITTQGLDPDLQIVEPGLSIPDLELREPFRIRRNPRDA